jgi:hypothetical protein
MALSPKMLAVLKKADAANAEYFAGFREKAKKQKRAEAREKIQRKARAKKKAKSKSLRPRSRQHDHHPAAREGRLR